MYIKLLYALYNMFLCSIAGYSKWITFLEKHARNVKSYREQLAAKRKEHNLFDSDEDCLQKLENLELAETNGIGDSEDDDDVSKLELDSKATDSFGSVECSDDGSHCEEHTEKPILKLNINSNPR